MTTRTSTRPPAHRRAPAAAPRRAAAGVEGDR
ncbi:hypothetical protein JOF54_001781 [Microlunatus capsulatus]|uniref:Uncharacterized protein n=1 Tax=Microlunatus capsulatus TaxID=99117 RepID=A0ABS4Z734_9ACTN|nr:hypothetical protein [Microlunatus capsulatus]